MDGVVRTRVGYAGGSKVNPTYYNLGDHTETIEIDFNPDILPFEKILDIFWKNHDPFEKSWSRQYMSVFFYHNEKQKQIIEKNKVEFEKRKGKKVTTEFLPYTKFYLAEMYHQKYYLQLIKELREDFLKKYPEPNDFINSNSTARVNGYAKGYGSTSSLMKEMETLGLSERSQKILLEIVKGYGR
jgi:peptide-methionine (S)-S-oxide reductase